MTDASVWYNKATSAKRALSWLKLFNGQKRKFKISCQLIFLFVEGEYFRFGTGKGFEIFLFYDRRYQLIKAQINVKTPCGKLLTR